MSTLYVVPTHEERVKYHASYTTCVCKFISKCEETNEKRNENRSWSPFIRDENEQRGATPGKEHEREGGTPSLEWRLTWPVLRSD